MAATDETQITLVMSARETQIVLNALVARPFAEVQGLIQSLVMQANKQLDVTEGPMVPQAVEGARKQKAAAK